jgi:chromosome segregation ATPase
MKNILKFEDFINESYYHNLDEGWFGDISGAKVSEIKKEIADMTKDLLSMETQLKEKTEKRKEAKKKASESGILGKIGYKTKQAWLYSEIESLKYEIDVLKASISVKTSQIKGIRKAVAETVDLVNDNDIYLFESDLELDEIEDYFISEDGEDGSDKDYQAAKDKIKEIQKKREAVKSKMDSLKDKGESQGLSIGKGLKAKVKSIKKMPKEKRASLKDKLEKASEKNKAINSQISQLNAKRNELKK